MARPKRDKLAVSAPPKLRRGDSPPSSANANLSLHNPITYEYTDAHQIWGWAQRLHLWLNDDPEPTTLADLVFQPCSEAATALGNLESDHPVSAKMVERYWKSCESCFWHFLEDPEDKERWATFIGAAFCLRNRLIGFSEKLEREVGNAAEVDSSTNKQGKQQTIDQTKAASKTDETTTILPDGKKPWTSLATDLKNRWFAEIRKRKQWIPRINFIVNFLNGKEGKRDKWKGVNGKTEDRRFQDNPHEWKADSIKLKKSFRKGTKNRR